jgi:hypothetical protein
VQLFSTSGGEALKIADRWTKESTISAENNDITAIVLPCFAAIDGLGPPEWNFHVIYELSLITPAPVNGDAGRLAPVP